MNYQSLNESIRSVTNPKVFKTSPQEDEFLTDLTRAQIAAIKPLMKSKNWNKLKAYLMSQKIVDKDFNDITKYKMDRDILSVLQRSFSTYHEQVENESFSSLVEEQRYIEEYIELLESALESIAEELELDPNELVEAYRLTPARSAVLDREQSKAKRYIKSHGAPKLKAGDYDGDIVRDAKGNSAGIMKKDSAQYPKKRAKFVNMKHRNDRINTLRGSVGKYGKSTLLDFDRKREQKSRRGTQAADRL